mmetsp:Transcript_21825/g.29927  ORF Transcript_21825/g.29927 Transcript_21825/m.29927 type:complete len:506 (-) Transcript_21825:297-1814(-)
MEPEHTILFLAVLLVAALVVAGDAPKVPEFCHGERGVCYTDLQVTVYRNGEHEEGVKVPIKKELCESFEDVEAYLGTFFPEKCSPEAPCKVYSEAAAALNDCADVDPEGNLYMVPKGRIFMWPTVEVGRRVEVTHLEDAPNGQPIVVETLSTSPRVFRLHNLFTHEEADAFIENALSISDEANRLKRSSTGAEGYTVNSRRTSENAFDGDSDVAKALKRRSMDLLGFPEFKDTWCDGMQILRYQMGQAYNKHMDPFDNNDPDDVTSDGHNYDSAGKGTNRFATILMYLSDVAEGGETVFPEGRPEGLPPAAPLVPLHEAVEDVRGRGLVDLFERGSWEEKMVGECRHRLAVKPKKGEAILFYSQHPDGRIDGASLHGGCPVLEGTKWAANLWLWNGVRQGYSATMEDGTVIDIWDPEPKLVTFTNRDWANAQLYWEDNFFSDLGAGQSIASNTFIGHQWNLRVDNAKPAVQHVKIPHELHYYEEGSNKLDIIFEKDQEVKIIGKR